MKKLSKTIVLAGGCFDILHLGHLKFLGAAKKEGDFLIVALENDENVRLMKGKGRPINPQEKRQENLLKTKLVDKVLILPVLKTADDYLKMVQAVKPDVIAVTAGDPQLKNKQKQAKIVGGEVKIVINHLPGLSTSEMIKKSSL